MKGYKVAVAVITIVYSVILLSTLGVFWLTMAGISYAFGDTRRLIILTSNIGVLVAFVILYLIFGLLFFRDKSSKGIAWILIVVNALSIIGISIYVIYFVSITFQFNSHRVAFGLVPYLIVPIIKLTLLTMYLRSLRVQKRVKI